MRSRSQNSAASSQSHNGTLHSRKTWLQRKTNRRPTWPVTIRSQPLCRQRKRPQPRCHRKHRRSPIPNRRNGYLAHQRTPKQSQNIGALLQNLHNHPPNGLNVPQMPNRYAKRMGRKMLLLPISQAIKIY